MKKTKQLKKLNLSNTATKWPIKIKKTKSVEEKVTDALQNVPRITNDTLSDHREDVLSSARKYIYPLQHSKHRIVRISAALLALVLILFFTFCGLDLYKLQGTSGFIYDVTKIIPFPSAKIGGSWVSYESYLFELRHNMHYYVTRQQADFSTPSGKTQLDRLKQESMSAVVQAALVKQLAKENHVSVSDQDVNNEVTLLRQENRLGASDEVFKEVLSQYWGWSEADFKRELKQQLLQQAVVTKLDTTATESAAAALAKLNAGADFGTLAAQLSDDATTKESGGQYPGAVTIDDRSISPQITAELFQLQPGKISEIVNTGYTLEILKVISKSGGSVHAAHIQFNLASINQYLAPLKQQEHLTQYIKF